MKQLHEENPPIEEDFNPWSDKDRAVRSYLTYQDMKENIK